MSDDSWLVVTLAGSGDTGTWIREYVGETASLSVVAVSERHVEAELRELVRVQPGHKQAVVTIDQRFMGFLAKRAIDTLTDLCLTLPSLVHPRAYVSSSASLGLGTRIGAGAVLGEGCSTGEHARVLERAVLGRGCTLGAFSTIDPGVVIGDRARVGAHSWIRAGVVLEPQTVVESSCELNIAGSYRGVVPEGTQQLAGLDGPARILRFG